ncbi:hypothetical protein GGQ64_005557 [Rhizobium azooxidifex]|uniref:Uncharacterized protein n=1 Tax=Mycoplana azooxidifex TaxID=1636188 RepID=A0A7W6DCY5_9HYPH|nr:hypothetical protein [Mycoplana azooxidifex]
MPLRFPVQPQEMWQAAGAAESGSTAPEVTFRSDVVREPARPTEAGPQHSQRSVRCRTNLLPARLQTSVALARPFAMGGTASFSSMRTHERQRPAITLIYSCAGRGREPCRVNHLKPAGPKNRSKRNRMPMAPSSGARPSSMELMRQPPSPSVAWMRGSRETIANFDSGAECSEDCGTSRSPCAFRRASTRRPRRIRHRPARRVRRTPIRLTIRAHQELAAGNPDHVWIWRPDGDASC